MSKLNFIGTDIGTDIDPDITIDIVCDIGHDSIYDIGYDIVMPAGSGGSCCQHISTATTDSEGQGHKK